jgi:hypothetical protein
MSMWGKAESVDFKARKAYHIDYRGMGGARLCLPAEMFIFRIKFGGGLEK